MLNSTFEERSDKRNKHLEYLKHMNSALRENQDLKQGLRQINKSLDKILKSSKPPKSHKFNSYLEESEEELTKRLESTEFLITKYKKEINSLKETQMSTDLSEKIKVNKEILILKSQINELENENSLLLKNNIKASRNEEKALRKELLILKERYSTLQSLIREDEKLISEFSVRVTQAKKIKNKAKQDDDDDLEASPEALKSRISELEHQKKQEENMWKSKINDLKSIIEEKETEISDLEKVFKEKDKSCRLKKMTIKAQQRENRVSPNRNLNNS